MSTELAPDPDHLHIEAQFERDEAIGREMQRAEQLAEQLLADNTDDCDLADQRVRASPRVESLAELAANPPPDVGWLVEQLWPADAYGVIAAEAKAGKTWVALDLAVNVTVGGSVFGQFPVQRCGPTLMFVGEGGRRSTLRRLQAVCEHYQVDPLGLHDLKLVYRVPTLSDQRMLAVVAETLAEVQPVLVILDPLYLAAAGADGSSLFSMAEPLAALQHLAESVGAALVVVHHWNKTGKGQGHQRATGAGAEQWGRILWSMAVDNRGTTADQEGSSDTSLTVHVRGGEVNDSSFTLRREVWADDPKELASPLHYRVSSSDLAYGDSTNGETAWTADDRLLRALQERPDDLLTKNQLQELDAQWAERNGRKPLQLKTVENTLPRLSEAGLVHCEKGRGSVLARYRLPGGLA